MSSCCVPLAICGDNCMTCITSNGEPMCDECDDGYVLNSDGMCGMWFYIPVHVHVASWLFVCFM